MAAVGELRSCHPRRAARLRLNLGDAVLPLSAEVVILDEHQRREVARNLDTTPELLPYLDELLQDLDELGCNLELIVETLRERGLPAGARVLDLACGKGAVGLGLAEKLGFTCEGVDLYAPFIERARAEARERGLAERSPTTADISSVLRRQLGEEHIERLPIPDDAVHHMFGQQCSD